MCVFLWCFFFSFFVLLVFFLLWKINYFMMLFCCCFYVHWKDESIFIYLYFVLNCIFFTIFTHFFELFIKLERFVYFNFNSIINICYVDYENSSYLLILIIIPFFKRKTEHFKNIFLATHFFFLFSLYFFVFKYD